MSSKAQLFDEIEQHLMQDERPSEFLNRICEQPLFREPPFNLLANLKKAKQSPMHHPEGNVWNHTMLVIDMAAQVKQKSKNPRAFLWAALLHDIGKPGTTRIRKGKITSYDHDKLGAELAEQFLSEFTQDQQLIQSVVGLVRWHMQILFVLKRLPFADIPSMKQQADIEEVALLGFCDRMGRLGANREKEERNIQLFLQDCRAHN